MGGAGTLIRCLCGLVRGEHRGPCCQEVSKADPAAWFLASQTFAVGKALTPYTLAFGHESWRTRCRKEGERRGGLEGKFLGFVLFCF